MKFALLVGLACSSLLQAAALQTMTTLKIEGPNPGLLSTSVETLVATVVDSNNNPVLYGTVTFLANNDVLGTVQLIAHPTAGEVTGTAVWRARFRKPGLRMISARFNPLPNYLASQSAPQQLLTVPPGKYPVAAPFALGPPQRDPKTGKVTLTAGVNFGYLPAAPGQNGSVTFQDLTGGMALGTVPVNFEIAVIPTQITDVAVHTVAAGDFNSDGQTDVISPLSGRSDLLLGLTDSNGNYTFTNLPVSLAAGSNATVAVGDFDGDGNLDFVYKADGSNTGAVVYLGNGDGTFREKGTLASEVGRVLTGDFNGDGILDVLSYGGNEYIFLGKGDGTFGAPILASKSGSSGLTFALDMNGDGICDLVTPSGVLIGDGDGTFKATIAWSKDVINSFAVGDVNGDGFPDAVVMPINATALHVYLNNGSGALVLATKDTIPFLSNEDSGSSLTLGDYNQDGKLDIMFSVPETNNPMYQQFVGFLAGHGDGSFDRQPAANSGGASEFSFEAAGSNIGDIIVIGVPRPSSSGSATGLFAIFLGTSIGGSFVPGQPISLTVNVPGLGSHQIQADYSGDTFVLPAQSNVVSTPTTEGDLALSQSSFTFVTNPGLTQTGNLQVTNNTLGTVTFKPAIQGSNAFQLTQTCSSLAPGASCTLTFTYDPAAVGSDSATLALNPTGGPAATAPPIPLSGSSVAPAVVVNPTSYKFSAAVAQTMSQTVTITNNLPYTVDLTPVLTGDPSFSVNPNAKTEATYNCEALSAFSSCGLMVTFSPTKAGTFKGTVTFNFVNAPAPKPPASVSLIGQATMPAVLVNPTQLHFKTAEGTKQTQTLTITNNTASAVHLSPTLKPELNDKPPVYVIGNSCATVAAKASCSLQITYTANSTYVWDTAVLLLNFSDAPAGTTGQVLLSGWGTTARLFINPNSANVTTNVGTYTPVVIQFSNDGPTPVQMAPSIVGNSSFTIAQTCATIPAHGGCNVTVKFTPPATGNYYGWIDFNFVGSVNAPITQTVLTGTGVQ